MLVNKAAYCIKSLQELETDQNVIFKFKYCCIVDWTYKNSIRNILKW